MLEQYMLFGVSMGNKKGTGKGHCMSHMTQIWKCIKSVVLANTFEKENMFLNEHIEIQKDGIVFIERQGSDCTRYVDNLKACCH